MARFLAILLLLGSGLAAYVGLSKDPIRIGAYALVGPSFAPRLTKSGFMRMQFGSSSLLPVLPKVAPNLVVLPRSLSAGQFDVGVLLWQWGSFRLLRVMYAS